MTNLKKMYNYIDSLNMVYLLCKAIISPRTRSFLFIFYFWCALLLTPSVVPKKDLWMIMLSRKNCLLNICTRYSWSGKHLSKDGGMALSGYLKRTMYPAERNCRSHYGHTNTESAYQRQRWIPEDYFWTTLYDYSVSRNLCAKYNLCLSFTFN